MTPASEPRRSESEQARPPVGRLAALANECVTLGASLRRSIAPAAAILLIGAPTALAASNTIEVTTTADEFGEGGECSLREAIESANSGAAFGGCNVEAGTPYALHPELPESATLIRMMSRATYPLTRLGDDDTNAGGDLDITSPIVLAPTFSVFRPSEDDGTPEASTIDASAVGDRVLDVEVPLSWMPGERQLHEVELDSLNITGGSAPEGGGVRIRNGGVWFGESTITGNDATDADGRGGGVLIAGDLAPAGGLASAAFVNTTVSGNAAAGAGGGVAVTGFGGAGFRHATVANNTARSGGSGSQGGGGIAWGINAQPGILVTSIIAANRDLGGGAADCADKPADSPSYGWERLNGGNVVGDISGCDYPSYPRDVTGADPGLEPLADNGAGILTHALASTSPALDRGVPSGSAVADNAVCVYGFDARGARRLHLDDPVCDAGAYERQSCSAALVRIVLPDGGKAVGGPDPDGMLATFGSELMDGAGGDDGLCGGPDGDTLVGGPGDDGLIGGGGADEIRGSQGNDHLSLEQGLGAGAGTPLAGAAPAGGAWATVSADGTRSRLLGGPGDDVLIGSPGSDELVGGPGTDTFDADAGGDQVDARDRRRERVSCGSGKDVARVDELDRTRGCERVLVHLPKVKGKRVRVKGRRAQVKVRCPAGGPACKGRLKVRTATKQRVGGKSRKPVLARGRYRVKSRTNKSTTRKIAAKLTAAGRRVARRGGRLRVRVILKTKAGTVIRRRLTLSV